MRIAINGRFLLARPTGVQRFAGEVAARIVAEHDAVILAPRGGPLRAFGVDVVHGRLGGALWEQVELPGAAARQGADVVLNLANSAPRHGGPHVQVLHDVTPLTRPRDFRAGYKLWARWAHFGPARRAALLVTVSDSVAEQISTTLGVPRARLRVARQGVAPLDAPAEPDVVAVVRARYGLPERYFLAVGSNDPRKRSSFLQRVFSRWAEEEPDALSLVLVGGAYGHAHAPGRRPARGLGHVGDEELRALYTGAEALLFPSAEEGFGRPPLEALACGTRVVAAPYTAAPEVLGAEADLVPPDTDSWVAALQAIGREPAPVRRRRIAAGRAWAGSYTWDSAVETLLDACLDARGRPLEPYRA